MTCSVLSIISYAQHFLFSAFPVISDKLLSKTMYSKSYYTITSVFFHEKKNPGWHFCTQGLIFSYCTSQQKLDTNFKFFYSKDWFFVQCYGCLDTSLFGWLECIRYGVIVKPACAPLMRLRALQSLHT